MKLEVPMPKMKMPDRPGHGDDDDNGGTGGGSSFIGDATV